MKRFLVILAGVMGFALSVNAAEVSIAVAANFTAPMQRIAAQFEKDTGHKAVLSSASTGRLYAQIKNGAPFDILLAADDKTPARLIEEGHTVAGSHFTYAIGKLVLWSKDSNRVDADGQVLRSAAFDRIAVAEPKLAPYGAAAVEVMSRLGVWEALQPKAVYGESIAQTYQFVASRNAQLGFVAMAQVYADGRISEGSAWVVPSNLYTPIRQDAVLLRRAANNSAAKALMDYLRTDQALAIIRAFGYDH
jgi:molybdate transport system substrate-binding protein